MKERTKIIFKITAIILFLMIAIEAFRIGIPYTITIGIMFISFSILFIPYLEKVMYIPIKAKIFIIITNFLTTAYAVKVEDYKYYKCIIATVIMMLFWIITILYLKRHKNEKDSKQTKKEK